MVAVLFRVLSDPSFFQVLSPAMPALWSLCSLPPQGGIHFLASKMKERKREGKKYLRGKVLSHYQENISASIPLAKT